MEAYRPALLSYRAEAFGEDLTIVRGDGEARPRACLKIQEGLGETMWYVIQTQTGKEEDLTALIEKLVSRELYEACFAMKRELLRRLGGRWKKVEEILFPSYVFVATAQPDLLFYDLKRVPQYSRLVGNLDGEFIPLEAEEEALLTELCVEAEAAVSDRAGAPLRPSQKREYVIPLSLVQVGQGGEITKLIGPLTLFQAQAVRFHLRKRYAIARVRLAGREHTIQLGILLDRDFRRDEALTEHARK